MINKNRKGDEMKQIYYHGTILTMEKELIQEAVYVVDGIIKKVGKESEILQLKNHDTELIDLQNHVLLPGFIDGHSHLSAVAYDLLMINLKPSPSGHVNSVDDLKRVLKEWLETHTLEKNEWLMGTGYDNTCFTGKQEITKYDLDEVSTEIPIAITHASGHVGVCNSLALEKLGYVGDYTVPEGGTVACFPGTNEPTGLLEENAFLDPSIKAKMSIPNPKKLLKSFLDAENLYASYGYTSVQDGFTDERTYPLLSKAESENLLFLDVTSYVSFSFLESLQKNEIRKNGNHYHIGGVKMFLDGSPQAKTAWLTEPYYRIPDGKEQDYCGFPICSDEEAYRYCKKCLQDNLTLHTHCNGDAAIDQLLRCYQKAKEDTKNNQDLRPVIIHAQTIRDDQLDKMKQLGMLASFFVDHVYYWGDYHAESVLGKTRAERISPIHSALEKGISFTIHQDSPVITPNAMFSIHNAVNRITRKGRILGEEQRISVLDALKAFTVNAAYQLFAEEEKGSIKEGKKADFVILSHNPLEVDKTKIKDIDVVETIKDGKIIYQNKEYLSKS